MSKMITAIIETYEQTGPNTFKDIIYTRNFSTCLAIDNILNWAESMGVKNATINSIKLAEYTGSSE